jgi:hypothetical protein
LRSWTAARLCSPVCCAHPWFIFCRSRSDSVFALSACLIFCSRSSFFVLCLLGFLRAKASRRRLHFLLGISLRCPSSPAASVESGQGSRRPGFIFRSSSSFFSFPLRVSPALGPRQQIPWSPLWILLRPVVLPLVPGFMMRPSILAARDAIGFGSGVRSRPRFSRELC